MTPRRISERFGLICRESAAQSVNFRMRRAPGVVFRRIIDGRDRGVVVNRVQGALDRDRQDQRDAISKSRPQSNLSEYERAFSAASQQKPEATFFSG